MRRLLVPLPAQDFDPTEVSVPWRMLEGQVEVVFATPAGAPAQCDRRMIEGEGLGLFRPLLIADARGRQAMAALAQAPAFTRPLPYDGLRASDFDALLLPGGHAPGMRPYLESELLQALVADFFLADKVVGAICHGVVLAARSLDPRTGHSVLHGRKTTALLRQGELLAWRLTRRRLGDYYRTYPQTVEDEVRAALASPGDFRAGPPLLLRDRPGLPWLGFTVRDGRYLSARWPGDAHRFAAELGALITEDSSAVLPPAQSAALPPAQSGP